MCYAIRNRKNRDTRLEVNMSDIKKELRSFTRMSGGDPLLAK